MSQHKCFTYFLHVRSFVSCGMCRKDVVLLATDDSHGQLADHQSLVTCGWDGRRRVTYWNNILMFVYVFFHTCDLDYPLLLNSNAILS